MSNVAQGKMGQKIIWTAQSNQKSGPLNPALNILPATFLRTPCRWEVYANHAKKEEEKKQIYNGLFCESKQSKIRGQLESLG